MSKHSKWAKIKRQKGATDVKRAANFTKLARAVTVAAREGGGDPNFNFKLRTAIDAALAGNMPKDNIDRAVKRGTGEGEGERIEEVTYEGFGPGGAAIMVTALTDSRNRTSSSLKHIFSVGGGNMGGAGAVQWMFEKKGIVRVEDVQSLPEDVELALIDAGAEDIRLEDGGAVVKTAVESLAKVKSAVEAAGLKPSYIGIEWLAKDEVEMADPAAKERLEGLIEELDADDDVDSVYTNVKL
jgi:YebC/PmpR family DNA-binding regulatory protein